MAKISKNRKAVEAKYNPDKLYSLEDASALLKDITFTKFDSSVDLDIRLGVDPKKSDQMVRGVVSLPHGLGKSVRVLVLCTPDKVQDAKDAGAEHVGLDEYIQKIEGGWTDIDVIICTPTVMAKVGKLGKVLGPRGLMPNPKSGTVTLEVGKAVKEVKAGKIDFKIDKTGIIHVSIGKASFSPDKIRDNAIEMINVVSKLKPASAKGAYFRSICLSTTMSPGVKIDMGSIAGI
ncbi:MAG: 50S ribosomal protein L1 [Cyclobacteriaceae bacterium]|nr:50S ribosomal protein L1 [Cyclobacteriaceae bacterium]